jgi:PAS domain S-box-containing protein
MAELIASGEKRRVLVIDSDASFVRCLEEDFAARGFAVEAATTPDEATSLVAASRPDLVVLDLYLAGGATLDLLRLWKTEAPELVVILVSGNASLPVVVNALNEGARRFFTKPVGAEALIDELESRQSSLQPYLSPLLAANHQLGSGALKSEGVDRFFAISPGLLCISGFDGYFKMLNPAWEKALGYSIEELCAQPHLELVHPDDRQKATDEALEMRGGHAVFRFKNRYRCKDGSYRWLEWLATPSREHRLIYASARDVTVRVRIERGLRDSNQRLKSLVSSGEALLHQSTVKNDSLVELSRAKDDLAAMIVHDLKNPLAVILANYDYVVEGFEGADDCLEALRDSQSAGRRMLRRLANLGDVARLECGTLDVRLARVALSALVRPIVEQRRVLAGARKIEIALLPSAEMMVDVDTDLMARTLENIFDNALRFTPDGGSIEVELREAGADVEMRIGNSGCAVPAEARETIFGKYEQGSSGGGRMNLGLGLYFCRLAIEAQGGRVWIEQSERLPTVFGIRLSQKAAIAPWVPPAAVDGHVVTTP